MAPRTYRLGRRASTAAATRGRILAAAAELYREQGVATTTLQAVAERADVSRGTVVNHFGGVDELLAAVADEVIGLVRMPDERILDGAADPEDRIRRYAAAILTFYDAGNAWWPVVEPVLDRHVLRTRMEAYEVALGRLQRAAFGPLAGDRLVMATANGFVHWAVVATMRAMGASLEEVIEAVGDAILLVVNRRTSRGNGGKGT
ncbi:MAG TPA: TetR/AcrR family transcriptional regulator [Candidatus Limnocylindrales bacterium]|nr:TetR/AcrR family transcriptional regulator [Candidatus Limnocylindrales bacterium]